MLFDDTYRTLSTRSESTFRDKGSKFIAYAFPLKNEDEVKLYVAALRNGHPKARHFCWAFRLSPDRNVFRINDDGEPAGTAGRPILNVMLSADVTNILVVVVRYFGGTLLGVPGLINAYKTATVESLKAATIIQKTVNDRYQVTFPYDAMNAVMRVIKEEQLVPVQQDFNMTCELQIDIRKSSLNTVLGKLEKIEHVKISYLETV